MALGEKVYKNLRKGPEIRLGNGVNETIKKSRGNSLVSEEELKNNSINFWDAIGKALDENTSKELFFEVKVYDGSAKRSNASENHKNNFIPEFNINNVTDPDYTIYKRNKIDITFVPEYDLVEDPPIIESIRNGYRVVIKNSIVNKDSIIRPIVVALDLNEENDLPSNYEHKDPSFTYIISQTSGEFQMFFSNVGCFYIKYGVWNGSRNVDHEPKVINFIDS